MPFNIGDRVKLIKVPEPPEGMHPMSVINKRYIGSHGTVVGITEGKYQVDLGMNRPIFYAGDSMLEAVNEGD